MILDIPGSMLLPRLYWEEASSANHRTPTGQLTWRRSAYCFFTSGIEVDTFLSVSRSFFRLALASERMISRLILKGTDRGAR